MPRLGKLEHRHDVRTLKLGLVMAPAPGVKVPQTYDFDKARTPFPISSLGNDDWGNCVVVSRANHTFRLERIENRTTVGITTPDVIEEYKQECQRQFGNRPSTPGDPYDNGLYMLEANKDWRNGGWPVKPTMRSKFTRKHSIAAYGEIEARDRLELRAAIYLLHGVQMGLSLPRTAGMQWSLGQAWTSVPTDEPDAQPGSWGGHAVYCKRFDANGVYCLTWGREVYMTNDFIERYCDECWAVVDDITSKGKWLDVEAMKKHLIDVGATVGF